MLGKPKDRLDLNVANESKVITVILASGEQRELSPITSADQLPAPPKTLTVTARPAEPTLVPRPADSRTLDRTYGPPAWPARPGRKPRW